MTPAADADRYPKRPPFFANRFLAYALRSGVNMDHGAQAFALLAAVVLTEDKLRYRKPVRFWNDNLTAYLGCREDRLAETRKRLVGAGWLHYRRGGKGVAGEYWVTVPGGDDRIDDRVPGDNSPVDPDQEAEIDPGNPGDNGEFVPRKSGVETVDEPDRNEFVPRKSVVETEGPEFIPRKSGGQRGGQRGGQPGGQPGDILPIPKPEPKPKKPMGDGVENFWLWKNADRAEILTPAGSQRVFERAVAAGVCTPDERVHVFRLVLSLRDTTNLPGALIEVLRGNAGRDPWRARGIECEPEARDWIRKLDVPESMQQRTSDLAGESTTVQDQRARLAEFDRRRKAGVTP